MKRAIVLILISILFFGCATKKPTAELPERFKHENFGEILELFQKNCQTKKALDLYPNLCLKAESVKDPKEFILKNFQAHKLYNEKDDTDVGLLTGYYLASIRASLEKTPKYRYPIYETPSDLVSVDLSSIYPELKHYRLRGRLKGGKLVPYYNRENASKIEAPVLCYCDSKVDRFFLEVQGSGKVYLDNNDSFFIGYDNQNGYKYRSIGRYLVDQGEIALEDISMQSIRTWLDNHPERIDEVLNYNNSMVFFKQRSRGAVGALGVELTPMRSIAVDRRYVKLGSMLYLDAELKDKKISRVVFAQDTGGAIKGSVRADFFTGFGKEAELLAGSLKAALKLWIFVPKEGEKAQDE
ncbi:MAG: MltA domain-containing protein [Sulfurimonas sp.]